MIKIKKIYKKKILTKLSARKRRIIKRKIIFYSLFVTIVILLSFTYSLSFSSRISIAEFQLLANSGQSHNKELKKQINKFIFDYINNNYSEYYPYFNYFLFDTQKIKDGLAYQFPKIHNINISKKNLNKIVIQYNERKPCCYLCHDDNCYLIDKSGFFFDKKNKNEIDKKLLEIEHVNFADIDLLRHSLDKKELDIIKIAQENINEKIFKIQFLNENQFNVYLNKYFVKFIANEKLQEEFEMLQFAKEHIFKDKEIEYIDLRFVPKIYYKEK